MSFSDWALLLTAFGTAASIVLHAIAPYTKTKLDDKVADAIDRALAGGMLKKDEKKE